jgi:hypothetical protein
MSLYFPLSPRRQNGNNGLTAWERAERGAEQVRLQRQDVAALFVIH